MKVAYLYSSQGNTVSCQLGKMILPQLEERDHGPEVVGRFFFEDNIDVLVKGDPIGERLAKVAKEQNIMLMGARDRRQAGRRCDDRLFSESLRGSGR